MPISTYSVVKQAREWIERIADPELREVVKADHARHHPENR